MITIMLVDDQPAMLTGMKSLIEDTASARIVASVSEPEDVISTALDLRPDLILLDVSLGRVSGIDVARALLESWPEARVLAVSAHADSIYVRGMFDAGARGYLLKDHLAREVASAIDKVLGGGSWLGAGLATT